jgi:hypothetical protein
MTNQGGQEGEHLRLLSVFHYVVGAMAALFGCIPIFHLGFGIFMLVAPAGSWDGGEGPPPFVGWMLVIMAGLFILAAWTFALCLILAGRFLGRRVHYGYCCVMAAIACMFMPLGTVLGVFTLIVLMRPSVKALFGQPGWPPAMPPT